MKASFRNDNKDLLIEAESHEDRMLLRAFVNKQQDPLNWGGVTLLNMGYQGGLEGCTSTLIGHHSRANIDRWSKERKQYAFRTWCRRFHFWNWRCFQWRLKISVYNAKDD